MAGPGREDSSVVMVLLSAVGPGGMLSPLPILVGEAEPLGLDRFPCRRQVPGGGAQDVSCASCCEA